MRVAIVGSRNFPQPQRVRSYVATLPEDTVVVTGGSRGVDLWAQTAAETRGLKVVVYPANWTGPLGRRAGLERNTAIVGNCDRLVAFWDGTSKGTADTIAKARACGREFLVYEPQEDLDAAVKAKAWR